MLTCVCVCVFVHVCVCVCVRVCACVVSLGEGVFQKKKQNSSPTMSSETIQGHFVAKLNALSYDILVLMCLLSTFF